MTEVGTRSATRARIVAVAAQLLADSGPAAVTTRSVAERAGVQAPTIYRLFGDKDGLLEAVTEHVLAAHVATKAAVVEAASAEEVDPIDDLRAGWDAQIAFGLANPTLFGLLSDPTRWPRSPAAQSGQRVLQARVHRIAMAGRLGVSEERAVGLIHAAGTGAVLTLLARPEELRDPGLAQDAYEAVLRQILTEGPATEASRTGNSSIRAAVVACRAGATAFEALTASERELLTEWLDRVIAEL